MITKQLASKILQTYKEAWEEQDVNKIISLFAKEGTYQERAFEEIYVGHEQIANYWQTKVCEEQSEIQFKILDYYISKDILIAEWDVTFMSTLKGHIHLQEIAIMQIKEEKIISFREYWHKEN